MEKRYQVFISSTFQDLQPARQEVSQALLRADCFPAGMELFPAADEEQFEFIKQIIDQSDYYIIISAGRYGSIHPETGLSYTEMEYDCAVETGKPVIRLLHKDPFNQLKGEYIEKTDHGKKKLKDFRDKLSNGKLVSFWEDEKQLGLKVREGLDDARKRTPAIGWIRSDRHLGVPAQSVEAAPTSEVLKSNPNWTSGVRQLSKPFFYFIAFALFLLASFYYRQFTIGNEKITTAPSAQLQNPTPGFSPVPNDIREFDALVSTQKYSVLQSKIKGGIKATPDIFAGSGPYNTITPRMICLRHEVVVDRLHISCSIDGRLIAGWVFVDEMKVEKFGANYLNWAEEQD